MKRFFRLCLLPMAIAVVAPPGEAQIQSLGLANTNDIGPLNWTGGGWYLRAIQRDAGDAAVGGLTDEISFFLNGAEYPVVEVTMSATAPSGHDLLFLRSNNPILIGDTVDGFVFVCGESSPPCSAEAPSDTVLGDNLSWTSVIVPGIFEDGFESGGTGRWSSTAPAP